MRRDTNGFSFVVNGAADGLPYPVRGIRAETVAFARIKAFGCRHQPDGALLHQILERHEGGTVIFGDVEYQTHIGFHQSVFGAGISGLHAGSQRDFLLKGQQSLSRQACHKGNNIRGRAGSLFGCFRGFQNLGFLLLLFHVLAGTPISLPACVVPVL